MLPGATWHKGVDLVAVERAASWHGPCPELTDDERRHAALMMTDAGRPAEEIAQRLGVSDKTVTRWRTARDDAPCSG